MTPKEQRELGIECMFHYPILANPVIMCTPDQLAAYTAAVESREREKCAKSLKLNNSELMLMAGELTTIELRFVSALLNALQYKISNLK